MAQGIFPSLHFVLCLYTEKHQNKKAPERKNLSDAV